MSHAATDASIHERRRSALAPCSCSPSYLWSDQGELWGNRQAIGFGCDAFRVEEMSKPEANAIIVANHYSKKTATDAHTRLCYGVHIAGELVGVLQFGYAMNPASGAQIVEGTGLNDYLELNRMWLSDAAPRNSESRAISYCLKTIKKRMPSVEWVMSFADERCGRWGVVYQAANFGYYGGHVSTFWELPSGEVIHNAIATNGNRKRKDSLNLAEAKRLDLRQFRYLYFIQPRAKRRCLLKREPYPKHASEGSMESRRASSQEGQGQILHDAPISSENVREMAAPSLTTPLHFSLPDPNHQNRNSTRAL